MYAAALGVGAAVAIGAYLLDGSSEAAIDRVGLDDMDAAQRPSLRAAPDSRSSPDRSAASDDIPVNHAIYSQLNAGRPLVEALDGASLHDRRTADIVNLAQAVCGNEFDPLDATNPRAPDETRLWAVSRLLGLCEGFDASNYELAVPGPNLSRLLKEEGADVAASEAMRALAVADDQATLFESGHVLIETGQFPLAEVLPDAGSLGSLELIEAWSHATTLFVCDRNGGCSSNSLQAAAFCATVGCKPGSSLGSAYRQRLPASEYRAMRAFYDWLGRQRLD